MYYACHVCGAVKQHFLPGDPDKAQPGSALVCDEKQGESVRKPTEPCYFTVMGEKARDERLSTEAAQVVHSNSRAFIGKR